MVSMLSRMAPKKGWTKKDWEEYARDLSDRIGEALDYFCHNISGDPLYECYESHMDLDLWDLVNEFADWGAGHLSPLITQKDVKMVGEMPKDVYDRFSEELKRRIEEVARAEREEAERIARELGEELEE